MSVQENSDLPNTPVSVLRGVGPERQAQLVRLDIRTIGDLLLHGPRRYEDRRTFRKVRELELHETAATRGEIVAMGTKRYRRGSRSVFELILEDGSGRLHCRWWNLPFMEERFEVGQELVVFGKVRGLKPVTIDHPETEVIEGDEERSLHLHRIVPVHPATEGMTPRYLRWLVWQALERFGGQVPEPWDGVTVAGLPSRSEAIRALHFPADLGDEEKARARLALDEFINLQLGIQRRRRNLQSNAAGLPCGGDNRLMRPFLAGLPFKLTDAQTRVLRELRQEMGGAHPMRRLLQGDVGCGKTVVAACCAIMALESGFEVAYMAPTEVLARQQWQTLRAWFEPLGIPVHLRTGSLKTDAADSGRSFDAALRSADFQSAVSRVSNPQGVVETGSSADCPMAKPLPAVTVGTHALIEAGFAPSRLGLVIIDEQHKFGVVQREALVRKGRYPHLLVMTATPIPRTLGLTLYGDLDVSVIDALPAERGKISTYVRTEASLPKVWDFVRKQVAGGRQAYVVYPRVEEADLQTGLKAVLQEHAQLEQKLAPHRVGLLHGRMDATRKETVMRDFRDRKLQVLVATSIIEVGLDVPNATVMVIENADRFGLAQLHQLRGRIGRGTGDSTCILVAGVRTQEARARLKVLAETQDGFRIAEADLQLRGPGELLGQSQSGLPPFRFGDLARDLKLVEQARQIAGQLLDREQGDKT
jgi:ATP-dependent DNA helicase RecG